MLPERCLQSVQCWQHPEAPSQEPETEGSAVSEDIQIMINSIHMAVTRSDVALLHLTLI